MGHIFLSYAREDRGFAECLAHVLEGAGHSVWWDRHIDSGEEFSAEIEAQLEKADVVVVAWSKDSVKSRWVRDEAAVGGDTGRLVPLSVDGSLPPMGFRQFHSLDLTGWKGGKRDKRTAQLLQSVERRIGKQGAPESASVTPRGALPRRKLLWSAAAALALLLLAAGIFFLAKEEKGSGAPLKPTIAIVPFTAASSDPELRALASQSRESIAHTFSQSGLPVRLLSSAPADGSPGADFLINGEVSRSGETVMATVRLDETAHGVTVFSHRFEATREEVGDLPKRIGAQMAGNLTWSAPLMMLDRRKPLDPALLADLLLGSDFTARNSLQTYQNAVRVAGKAPNVRIAQISKAFNTAFVLDEIPRGERAQAVADGRRAADRAMALGSDFGDIYGTWCLLHSETLMAECEDRLRAGRRVDPDAPFLNSFLSQLLRAVGRFDESVELNRLTYSHDPYVPTKIGWMLRMLEYSGDGEAARELNLKGAKWWPEFKPSFFRQRLSGLIDRGDWDAMSRLEDETGAEDLPEDYPRSDTLAAAVKSKSRDAAQRACAGAENYWFMVRCMIALASVGDQDGAYAIAGELYPRRLGRTRAESEQIWLNDPDRPLLEFITSPAAAPLRRDPRYLQLAQRTGLLDYWRSGRPPDFCRKKPEPICAQLLKR